MTAKILNFTGDTTVDLEPNVILEAACDKLDQALILGWTVDGDLYMATTTSQIEEMLVLLERAKQVILGE